MQASKISELYDAYYYATGCGLPCNHEEKHWPNFFGAIAERILADFKPRFILDAGCALGFLVQALRQRGAEAFGIDISQFAIGQVDPTIKPYCRVRSVTQVLPRHYDLIVCIEVLEHMPAA